MKLKNIVLALNQARKYGLAIAACVLILFCALLNYLVPVPQAHAQPSITTPSAYLKDRVAFITNSADTNPLNYYYLTNTQSITSTPYALFRGRGNTLWLTIVATNATGSIPSSTNVTTIVDITPDGITWVPFATNTQTYSGTTTNNGYYYNANSVLDNAAGARLRITSGTNGFLTFRQSAFP